MFIATCIFSVFFFILFHLTSFFFFSIVGLAFYLKKKQNMRLHLIWAKDILLRLLERKKKGYLSTDLS